MNMEYLFTKFMSTKKLFYYIYIKNILFIC